MFIVLEGIDGCGKSTQAQLMKEWLEEQDKKVFLTSEPTKNEIGQFIREVLTGNHQVTPKTLALLFTADRYEHLENEILPNLAEGKVVISERYYHSTICYQEAQGLAREWLLKINKFARKPDLTLFLDVKPETGAKRTKTREIFEKVGFLKKVRENYLKFGEEVTRIDANNKKTNYVFKEIVKVVSPLLSSIDG